MLDSLDQGGNVDRAHGLPWNLRTNEVSSARLGVGCEDMA